MSTTATANKPVVLYDHLPGILAGYPAVLFALLALLSLPQEFVQKRVVDRPEVEASTTSEAAETPDSEDAASDSSDAKSSDSTESLAEGEYPWWVPNPHMLFWIGLSVMLIWYIAFRFNLPKNKFILVFGLIGTFVGIPVVFEIFGVFKIFTWMAVALGYLAPQVNAGAFFVLSIVFFIIWISNFVYSRTHMRVIIDESGLTINRLGGKGERFELIGLKTENEPLDYLELFLAGVGSLALKTRMNKEIFKMDRVVGLYRLPFFPFTKGKLERIEEMLSYQGKVVSVETHEAVESADHMEAESEESVSAGGDELGESDESAGGESGGIK